MRNRSPLAGTSHAAIEYRTLLLAYICTRNSLSRTKVEIERLDLDVLVAVLAICLHLPGCRCIIHSEVSFAAWSASRSMISITRRGKFEFCTRAKSRTVKKLARMYMYIWIYADVYIILIAHNQLSTFCITKKKWSKKCFQ